MLRKTGWGSQSQAGGLAGGLAGSLARGLAESFAGYLGGRESAIDPGDADHDLKGQQDHEKTKWWQ